MRLQLESNGFRDWSILIHASARDATYRPVSTAEIIYFNPRIRKGCDERYTEEYFKRYGILIHASARDATAKSHKIDSDFTVLFRKFMQKLGIAIFTISIFLEK